MVANEPRERGGGGLLIPAFRTRWVCKVRVGLLVKSRSRLAKTAGSSNGAGGNQNRSKGAVMLLKSEAQ